MERPVAAIVGAPGRIAAAAIALVAWAGLGVQLIASIAQAGSIGGALAAMLLYFTVLTNLAVAIVTTGIALKLHWAARPAVIGGVTLAIMLVGIVYILLLHGLIELSANAKVADRIMHYVVPAIVPIFWLVFAPKGGLRRAHPLIWSLFPMAYLVYALVRGGTEGKYPYPFTDPGKIGWDGVAAYSVAIAAGFVATGFALLWIDRKLA